MIIKRTKRFLKAFKKCPKNIQLKIIERLELFLEKPTSSQLNIHNLKGKFDGIKSFNVTGDYRIWFIEDNEKDELSILLLHVGTHSQLY